MGSLISGNQNSDEAAATPLTPPSALFLTSHGGLHMTVTQFSQRTYNEPILHKGVAARKYGT